MSLNRQQRRAATKSGQVSSGSAVNTSLLKSGVDHHHAGRLAEAEACYRRILTAQPDHADALHLLGLIAHQVKNHAAAVDLIGQAIARNSRQPAYFSNLGLALMDLGRSEEALASYGKALALKPDYAEAYNNRGFALSKAARLDAALADYDKAVALNPNYAQAHKNRGNVLNELKRYDQAIASFDRALALDPTMVAALNNRGNALRELKQFTEALASYDKVLSLQPEYAEIINNRASVLRSLGRFEEALASYDKVLSLSPRNVEAFTGRGACLHGLKRFDEAIASYGSALAIDPNYALAHWNESLLRLLTGELARGFVEAEWRWQCPSIGLRARNFAQPLWLGDRPIDGKTIFVHSDQGLGDAIQFSRYVPMLASLGARVILEVPEPLRELMSGLAGVSQCLSATDASLEFDLHCPICSLPAAFGTRLDTIPSAVPYLPVPAADWDARLGPAGRPRIGLVWSGSAQHTNDLNRSIALKALSPLFDVEATFVSLQKEVRPDDAALLKERGDIIDLGPALESFADTAAAISRLDLVISVDTSVAHLAGALGRPVWIMLPFIPDWRWLLDRDDSPWYPNARLFRQSESREWPDVINNVREALRGFVVPSPEAS